MFEKWMDELDYWVTHIAGVSVHDLADQPFYDWFSDGINPRQAARLVLSSEGF